MHVAAVSGLLLTNQLSLLAYFYEHNLPNYLSQTCSIAQFTISPEAASLGSACAVWHNES